MSFTLDRYEPVVFHTHPDLMRAAEAQTAVLHPPAPPLSAPDPTPPRRLTPSPAPESSPTPAPVMAPDPLAPPTPAPSTAAPPEPIAAYLVGMDATPLLRTHLADFLDAAGSRRDVRVSVGVAAHGEVTWVLRDEVPYRVRALPRYPDATSMSDACAALPAIAAAVAADAADDPARRQLVVLDLEPVSGPGGSASQAGLRSGAALCRRGAQSAARPRRRWDLLAVGPVPPWRTAVAAEPRRSSAGPLGVLRRPTSRALARPPARAGVGRSTASRRSRRRPGRPARPPTRSAAGRDGR